MATLDQLKHWEIDFNTLASCLSAVISQRLVRKICEHCREPYTPSAKLLATFNAQAGELPHGDFCHGKGCETCNYTGYHNRFGVYYVFLPNSKNFRDFLTQAAQDGKVAKTIVKREKNALLQGILAKVAEGTTSLEELARVLWDYEHSDKPHAMSSGSEPPAVPVGIEKITEPSEIVLSEKRHDTTYAFAEMSILLVDDDEDMTQRLRLILEEKHFVVDTAFNGHDALKKIARNKPHLVITDVMMPGMGGLELIRHLRKNIATAFIPIIVLSSRNTTADRLKGFAVGTDDYLPKPFSIHELFFRVNAILRRVYA
jgi:CheY-like chemotaxis protein